MAGLLISFYAFVIHDDLAASRLTVKEAVADVKTAEEEAHAEARQAGTGDSKLPPVTNPNIQAKARWRVE